MNRLSGVELMAYCAGENHFLAGKSFNERPQLITKAEREAFQRGYDASADALAGFERFNADVSDNNLSH